MVSRKRAVEAVRAVAHGVEKGELLSFLRHVSDQDLGECGIEDDDDDETVFGFIRREALAGGAAAGLGVGSAAGAGGGAGGAAAATDDSSSLAMRLFEPELLAPPEADGLYAFFTGPPPAPIPVSAAKLPLVHLRADVQKHFTAATGELAEAFGHSLAMQLVQGSTEAFTMLAEHTVVVSLLVALDTELPPSVSVGLVVERDQQDETSMMTVTSEGGGSLRPDGVLRDQTGGRLLAKWENNAPGLLQNAIEDLRKKTAAWTPLYYGNIKYLPCFAAAGNQLQFFAILRASGLTTDPRPVTPVYNLANPNHRAEAVMATVKFYQLLWAQLRAQQRGCYPQQVLPAAKELVASHPTAGFTRSVYFRTDELTLRKRLSPWSSFADWCGASFADVRRLYRATEGRQGLVHAVRGPSMKGGERYSVDLAPVGLRAGDALPRTEAEARDMAHGLLHGLAALHEAGFVHRDLRRDNVACCAQEPRRWFLIDLESGAAADQEPPGGFKPAGWELGVTLVGGRYTRESDIYQLGRVVQEACARKGLELSTAGREVMDALLTRPTEQRSSATELLSREWFRCAGAACRVAGAQPGER